jgi:hypothetical protein
MDLQTKPPRGQVNPLSVDARFGRRWLKRGDVRMPVLYSRIGEQLRNPKLHRTICRWVIGAPNWIKMITEKYRKRWPMYRGLRASLFAEFALKPFETRTFSETCHTLPSFGVGFKFWRGPAHSEHGGNYFLLKNIDYRFRPFHAEARGDLFMNNILIRQNVAPLGKSVGKWKWEAPPGTIRPPFPERSVPYPEKK